MARYSFFVLKVPLNPKQPTNLPEATDDLQWELIPGSLGQSPTSELLSHSYC